MMLAVTGESAEMMVVDRDREDMPASWVPGMQIWYRWRDPSLFKLSFIQSMLPWFEEKQPSTPDRMKRVDPSWTQPRSTSVPLGMPGVEKPLKVTRIEDGWSLTRI